MTSTGNAEVVVVGRIVGLVDQKPGAEARRTREVHLVDVERTLKGPDEAGLRLLIRPNGEDWHAGQSYLLFLKREDLRLLSAIPGSSRAASTAELRQAVRALGAVSPQAQRVLWMQQEGGFGHGPRREFWLSAEGHFAWITRDDGREGWRGRLPADIAAKVVARVRTAGPGPQADDAGTVTFRFFEPDKKVQYRTYSLPNSPPASELLNEIRELARKYGKPDVEDKA